jgi:hypothetical protein
MIIAADAYMCRSGIKHFNEIWKRNYNRCFVSDSDTCIVFFLQIILNVIHYTGMLIWHIIKIR